MRGRISWDMEAGLIASLLRFCYIELQFRLHNSAGPGVKIYKASWQLIHSKRHILFVAQKQILGDLATYLAIEMSKNNTLTHGKLWRCQTKRSNTQITAEIMQTYEICRNTI